MGSLLEGCTIRRADAIADYDACEELQRRAFRYQDLDIVPANELISAEASGGLVLVACQDHRPVGFCFGLVGREPESGLVYHFSRMVAVDPEVRGRGVAQALKRRQREEVLAQGLDIMRWTFDPLMAENAHLNLARLGAEAIRYVCDFYGPTTSSPLHQVGTDRLLLEWRLREDAPRPPDPAAPRVEVPREPDALKLIPGAAREARLALRAALEGALAAGWVAVGFAENAYRFARRRPLVSAGSGETAPLGVSGGQP